MLWGQRPSSPLAAIILGTASLACSGSGGDAVCGNGIVETGEECELGRSRDCTAPCEGALVALVGTRQSCGASCHWEPTCAGSLDPGAWSYQYFDANGTIVGTKQVDLPDVGWAEVGRRYVHRICPNPVSVSLRFSSDNTARLFSGNDVLALWDGWNGVFADFYEPGYCTDKPIAEVNRCCDTIANCYANLSQTYTIAPGELAKIGTFLMWEVMNEGGGSGFYVEMDVVYPIAG